MLDQLAGKPSPSWRRSQVLLVLIFWLTRLFGNRYGPRILYLRRLNRILSRFTPWQIVLSTLTFVYAIRHADVLLGLSAPEPLARLYSRDYYRATWFATALDAGFATAMSIKWKWMRDIASLAFSGYYLLYAHEADEKLRKYRAFCTVEMLRATWEKQSNPYIRFATRKDRPPCEIQRKVFLPRPKGSKYTKPITAHLYFHGSDLELAAQHELIMDLPGGGFICMNPEHHAERILRWARQTGRPVLSFDYGKAPEYPFPFAIDEMYDAYSLLLATKGKCIGMNSAGEKALSVILTGDSAGANIATAMVVKILETRPASSPQRKPASSASASSPSASQPPATALSLPTALVFAYPALSFHFTSWMPSSDLRVLRSESHPDVASILRGKEHLDHRAPLSVVEDVERRSSGSERGRPKVLRRKRTTSWGRGLVRGLPGSMSFAALRGAADEGASTGEQTPFGGAGGDDDEAEEVPITDEREKSLSERVLWWDTSDEERQKELKEEVVKEAERLREEVEGKKGRGLLGETRLAMTSRTAFFNDRIISPPMCRAMALLYIGPRNAPDLHSDYHISPIFTPPNLLAQFPPVYISCGERDPFVDDTVIFAGKLREAKEARKMELLARQSRHGESLRMSGSSTASQDPILDETEEDWVRTSIIAGWSHGYLQMVSLLPAAEKVIALMGGWIEEAFERAEGKQPQRSVPPSPVVKAHSLPNPTAAPKTLSPIPASPTQVSRQPSPFRPRKIMPPAAEVDTPPSSSSTSGLGGTGTPLSTAPTPVSATPPSFIDAPVPVTSQADDDDDEEDGDILTFTPKRRRGSSNASRAGSPSPVVRPSAGGPLPRSALRLPSSAASGAASLDAVVSTGSALPSPSSPPASTTLPTHLVTPAERALRDELASLSLPHAPKHATASALPATVARGGDGQLKPHFFTEPLNSPLVRPGSAAPASYLDAAAHQQHGASVSRPRTPSKAGRSGSAGSLPPPTGTIFVDAKDLLRRRRDDVVFGISVSGEGSKEGSEKGSKEGSAAVSEGEGDEMEDGGEGGAEVQRRKTAPA
ncbi:hypothetical protein JCM6882_007363 [Rhodosporidiobolus microsporus]